MDYLLRDSLHCGVDYGHFDLGRIVDTLMIVEDTRDESPAGLRIGLSEGGVHAAEGLILARYFMFTQVYFHPVRKAFDYHGAECTRFALAGDSHSGARLPDPRTAVGRRRFLDFDDWSVLNAIKRGKAGRHGQAILRHQHDRCVHKTTEVPRPAELEEFDEKVNVLRAKGLEVWVGDAQKEWYTVGKTEVRIGRSKPSSTEAPRASPLSEVSDIVAKIPESARRLLFVPDDHADGARGLIKT